MLCNDYSNQVSSCSLNCALRIFSYINNIGVIVHGPEGCGYSTLNEELYQLPETQRGKSRFAFVDYSDKDIILGGEIKLENAIKEFIDRYSVKDIVILKTCLPSITGDDYELVLSNIMQDYDVKLYLVNAEGISYKNSHDVYNQIVKDFYSQIIKDEVENIDNKLLNIITAYDITVMDYKFIYKLLLPLGIKVNFIPFNSDIEDIKNIRTAKYNMFLCSCFGDSLLGYLEEIGCGVIRSKPPLSIESTKIWLEEIAELYEVNDKSKLKMEKKYFDTIDKISDLSSKLKDKSVVVCTGKGKLLQWSKLCSEIGLDIVLLGCIHSNYPDISDFDFLDNVNLINDIQWVQQKNYIEYLEPDFYVGKQEEILEITCLPTKLAPKVGDFNYSMYGYDGIIKFAEYLIETMSSRNKPLVDEINNYYLNRYSKSHVDDLEMIGVKNEYK